jgi:tetratricopeptide (TPR) repeat protein
MGIVYRYLHEFLQSENSLRRCLELYPDLAIGHRALGFTLAYLDRTDEAIAELELALKSLPDDPDTLNALRQIREH